MAFERDGFNRQGFAVRSCSSGLRLGCGCRRFQNPGSTPDDIGFIGLKSSSNLKDTQ